MWKSPSKRRIPRLLIENRAHEVGVLIYIEEPWVVFRETGIPVNQIDATEAQELEFYARHYHLLPAKFKRQDAYDWMNNPHNALLLWGEGNRYFIKASRRS